MEDFKDIHINTRQIINPPLKINDTICTGDIEKANLLNMHFKTQSDLNDTGKEIPHITQSNPNN